MTNLETSIKVDINECPNVQCSCGSILWDNAMIVKRISPIYSSNGEQQFANIPVIVCKKCGNDIRLAIDTKNFVDTN